MARSKRRAADKIARSDASRQDGQPVSGGLSTVNVDPAGALDGDGSVLTPLAVKVDGSSLIINGSNELESTGSAIGLHAATHEDGGSDEINVGGLSGVLADPQPPIIGAGATQAVAGNDARLANARTPTAHAASHAAAGADAVTLTEAQVTNLVTDLAAKAPTARVITAGAGLTGGGDLSADRTLNVGAGIGITVNADDIAVNYGATAITACVGNDARLSDARAPTAHNLLSASHGDTLAAAVARGSLIVGNATPKWSALAIGPATYVVKSDGTDAAWGQVALSELSDAIIAAPAADQILKYNGVAWVNAASTTVNGGAGIDFYPDDTASDIATYAVLNRGPENVAETDISAVANGGRTLIKAYASPVAGIGGAQVDPGEWIFDVYGYVNLISLGTSSIDIDVFTRTAGGVETLRFNVNSGALSAAIELYSISTIQQAIAIAATDRLVVKIYAKTTAVVNRTCHLIYGGSAHYSNLSTPLVTRHNDLAGLQGGAGGAYHHLPAPTRGQIAYATATPAWAGLAAGAAKSVLTSNGTDPAWSTTPTVASLLAGPGAVAAVSAEALEVNYVAAGTSGGLAIAFGPNPGNATTEGYLAAFAYTSTGVGTKVGVLAFRWTDATNANGYASANLHVSWNLAGVQHDDIGYTQWGNHGIALWPGDLTGASAPGANIFTVNGTTKTRVDSNAATTTATQNLTSNTGAYAQFVLDVSGEAAEDLCIRQHSAGFTDNTFRVNSGGLILERRSGGLKLVTTDGAATIEVWTSSAVALLVAASGQTQLVGGSAGAPALSTITDTNTGVYFDGADGLLFATGATLRATFTSTGRFQIGGGTVGSPALSTLTDTDTGLYFDGANGLLFATAGVHRGNFGATGGLSIGAPTGGDKGAGTINVATNIYLNNALYTNPDYVFEHYFSGDIARFARSPGAASYPGLHSLDALRSILRATWQFPQIARFDSRGLVERFDIALELLEEAHLYIFELHDRLTKLEGEKR